jgi:hypothetical protein
MNPFYRRKPRTPGKFRVGDKVRIVIGYPGATAEILEDHGPLGVGGQRFYFIHMHRPGAEDIMIAYPEDEMAPLDSEDTGERSAS